MFEAHDLAHLVHQFELGIGDDRAEEFRVAPWRAGGLAVLVLTLLIPLHTLISGIKTEG